MKNDLKWENKCGIETAESMGGFRLKVYLYCKEDFLACRLWYFSVELDGNRFDDLGCASKEEAFKTAALFHNELKRIQDEAYARGVICGATNQAYMRGARPANGMEK